MNRPQPVRPPQFITLLGKVMNVLLALVCATATIWAGRLFMVRQGLPYDAAGQYVNPQTGIIYDDNIVRVALGLTLLFGALTLLLLLTAYKLYRASPRRKAR
ncbi:hypothetical protein [Hymenobacter metallicola]|uniref:Uncharacterized protein n=1 Tax=Hymenobacter metallicola TaxID=2563114 RepID=A0A4Z0Q1L4_9BACT|nr:hypothetical protein [Hymenobacter metallicola]TGE23063.1 hypothetical protein E5K02_22185 [Hymenobacter metallicola]